MKKIIKLFLLVLVTVAFTCCQNESDDLTDGTFNASGVESSQVLAAKPASVTITADRSRLNFSSTHTLYAESVGATSYSWQLMGNARFEDGNTTITTSSKNVKIKTLENSDPSMGQLLKVSCTASNKYGSARGTTTLMFVMGR